MTRTKNAAEFRKMLGRLRADYDRFVTPRLDEVRNKYSDPRKGGPPESIAAAIEWHLRVFLINSFLAALNWRMNLRPEEGLPNLIPEAPVRSEERGSVRHLDYLGVETETLNPLMIVETKRPQSTLPELADGSISIGSSCALVRTLSEALKGCALKGEWDEWLKTLCDYVRSVTERAQRPPKRVVITDGNWFVVFLDPRDAFLPEGTRNPDLILALGSWDEMTERAEDVFLALEHGRVLDRVGPLRPEEVPFHLERERVDGLLHGLVVHYIEIPGIRRRVPQVRVSPVLLVRSDTGAWFEVEAMNDEYVVPDTEKGLAGHLRKVRGSARALLKSVKASMRLRMVPRRLIDHYRNPDAFLDIPGVKRIPSQGDHERFKVATGNETHYIMPTSSVAGCPFHHYRECLRRGLQEPGGEIAEPTVDPPCLFTSGRNHHCAHVGVYSAKRQAVDSTNRDRCGQRSSKNGGPFCEIFGFETHLC